MAVTQEYFGGVLYLYNGSGQPEVWTVKSDSEILRYAAAFQSARLERPGQPPLWIKPKKVNEVPLTEAEPDPQQKTSLRLNSGMFYDGWQSRRSK
jgi:hypothetical protein